MLKTEHNTLSPEALSVLTMPKELRKFVFENCTNPSPYNGQHSGSFYNCNDKSWDYTPDGSIRVSDHWNFYSRGKYHCITNISSEKIAGKWVVAKYSVHTGMYHVISADDKCMDAFSKRNARQSNISKHDILEGMKEKRHVKAMQIRWAKEAKVRAKKIRNGATGKGPMIWAEVNVNLWSGYGRRWKHQGNETLVGCITWESKTGSSFEIWVPGERTPREIRKTNSYKELNRKPSQFWNRSK